MKHLLKISPLLLSLAFVMGCSSITETGNVEERTSNNGAVQNANRNASTGEKTMNRKITINDPVGSNLSAALDRWSGYEGEEYPSGISLKELWQYNHPPADYDREGIDMLLDKLKEREIFSRCPTKLKKAQFNDGETGINTSTLR